MCVCGCIVLFIFKVCVPCYLYTILIYVTINIKWPRSAKVVIANHMNKEYKVDFFLGVMLNINMKNMLNISGKCHTCLCVIQTHVSILWFIGNIIYVCTVVNNDWHLSQFALPHFTCICKPTPNYTVILNSHVASLHHINKYYIYKNKQH